MTSLTGLLDAVDGVRQLLPALQVDAASKHTAKQLWRGITGGGSNYEEAVRGGEHRRCTCTRCV